MGMDIHEIPEPSADPAVNQRRLRWGLMFFLAIALYFLVLEHRAHVVAALPWLLLLSCPFMHLFMHRGHGSHHQGHGAQANDTKDAAKKGQDQHAGHGCC